MVLDSPRTPIGRIITFYSYKGGTGRSMALANIAWLLASAGRRVLVIDWDLEAPGLHRYFAPFLIDEEVTGSEGLIDLVDAYSNEAIGPRDKGTTADSDWFVPYTDFSNYVVSVNFRGFPTGGGIDFLPAGRQGDHYALAVSSFNWQNFYDRLGGGGFFEAIKHRARKNYDYVLIDSRTGVSDTAGICSVQMPDTLVVCFTYNNQSIKGAAAVARSAIAAHQKLVDEQLSLRRSGKQTRFSPSLEDLNRKFRVFPVPMRVDDGESDRLAIRQAFAKSQFADLIDHIGPAQRQSYWEKVKVPYRVFYSYEEVLAPFKDNPQNPSSVLHAQIELTKQVTDGDVSDFQLLLSSTEQKKWLDAYAATPNDETPASISPTVPQETEEQVLARKADVAMAALPQSERPIARRVLLRLVRISPAEEGAGYLAIRARLSEFKDDERHVVEKLASYGVLTIVAESPSSEPTAGIDSRLLKAWPTLSGWVDEDQGFLAWRQELRSSLAAWLRSGRDNGSLLSGRSLNEADLNLLRRRIDLSDAEIDYIEQSRTAMSSIQLAARSESAGNEAGAGTAPAPRSPWMWPVGIALAAILIVGGWAAVNQMRPDPAGSTPVDSRVTIPKFEALTSEQARSLAAARGLTLVMTDGKSPDQSFIPGVLVVSQTPAAEALARRDDPIRLTVAAPTATVVVPQLAGELSLAAKLLGDAGLRLGQTDYRYVPNAPLGHVSSQKPDAGAIVGPGTPIDLTVTREPQLNEVQIAIYYLAKDAMLATAIRDFLVSRRMRAVLRERDMDFFTKRIPARTNQIRYSRTSEGKLQDELSKLLIEGKFGKFQPAPTRNTTDGFISIFLAAYPEPAAK
jgi:hypothetical protein